MYNNKCGPPATNTTKHYHKLLCATDLEWTPKNDLPTLHKQCPIKYSIPKNHKRVWYKTP